MPKREGASALSLFRGSGLPIDHLNLIGYKKRRCKNET